MCTVTVSMPGSGSVSRRRPFASWYSVTPSSETTLRGASAATAQAAHSSEATANSRFIRLGALFLLLATLLRFLGAGFTLRRVFRLRAHLVAHAIAARVALLACAGLLGLAMRRLHLRGALQAGLGILRLGAHLLAHAVAARVALLAFAGLFGAAVRRFELRDAFLATRGILRLRAVDGLGENAGAGREEQHADQGFEHENGPFVLTELPEKGGGVRHLELAGALDVELLHHAVVHQHREALHPGPHAAGVQIELQAERLGPLRAAVAQEADLAERLLVAAPVRHDEGIVGRHAPDLVHALALELLQVLHVARHVLRRAGGRISARQAEDGDLLAPHRVADVHFLGRHRALRAGIELGGLHELALGQAVADFNGHGRISCGRLLGKARMIPLAPGYDARMSMAWLRTLAVIVAVAGALLLLASGAGVRLGLWTYGTGFALLRYAAYIGIAAAVLALVALFLPQGRARWIAALLAALGVGAATAYLPYSVQQRARSAPRINDITTDTEKPPQFKKPLPYGGPQVAEQQHKAYPDIQPAVLAAGPEAAFARALAAAQAMGWDIVDAQPKEGRIEATATTFWFGFKDDVVVRITPLPAGSRIDVRSKSRVGRGDAGTNAQRVRAYLKRLN